MANKVGPQGYRIEQFEKMSRLQEQMSSLDGVADEKGREVIAEPEQQQPASDPFERMDNYYKRAFEGQLQGEEAQAHIEGKGTRLRAMGDTESVEQGPVPTQEPASIPVDPFDRQEQAYDSVGDGWAEYRNNLKAYAALTGGRTEQSVTIDQPAEQQVTPRVIDDEHSTTVPDQVVDTTTPPGGALSLDELLSMATDDDPEVVPEPSFLLEEETLTAPGYDDHLAGLEAYGEAVDPEPRAARFSKGSAYAVSSGESSFRPEGIHVELTQPGARVEHFSDTVTQVVRQRKYR